MADDVIKNLFRNVYRDDYRDSDNFYRILFNNGRFLQQRELNQLQTILHEDIKASSSASYRNGAAAVGGQVNSDPNVRFAKLNTTTNALPTNYLDLEGEIFAESISGIRVRISKILPAEGSDPATIYVVYIDNNNNPSGADPILLTPGRNIIGETSGTVLTIQTTNTVPNPALGTGTLFTVNAGRFYVDGHFVFTGEQTIVLSKYGLPVNPLKIGFIVNESIITADDDIRLYDNSGANYNLASPGADRYKITLTLSTRGDAPYSSYFLKLAEVDAFGKILKDSNSTGQTLGSLSNVLETYRYEESGNYAVRNFKVTFTDEPRDDSKIRVTLNPGKAYVGGRRVIWRQPQTVLESKPRTTKVVNNSASSASYGNYLECTTLKGIPAIDTLDAVQLKNTAGYTGTTIGYARVRSVEQSGSLYKVYIFDVQMEPGYNFGLTRSIGTGNSSFGTNWYADVKVETTGIVELKEKFNNNLFFPLQYTRPKSFSDITLTTQKRVDNQTVTGGSVAINADTGHVFDDTGSWIIVDTSTGLPESGYSVSLSGDLATATITNLSASNVDLLVYQQKSVGQVKTKTLTDATATIAVNADGSVDLGKADIYKVTSVRIGTSTGTEIANRYSIDNGQRDNFYGVGKLLPKPGKGAPTSGNVYVTFSYFAHSATGDFFAASSYTGQIDYANIPSHRQVNGEYIQLRDVLDFRPRKNDAGTGFTGTGSATFKLPRNTDLINYDIEIYLGIKGRVVISRDNWFGVYFGEPDENPIYPSIPGEATGEVMEIMKFHWNPYLLSVNDMTTQYMDNRRYTMRDIGALDKRVSDLQELTALTLLELETQTLEVLDSDGLTRFKAGITADSFANHGFSDTNLKGYRASIDPVRKQLRPQFRAEQIELVYDSAESTNAVLKGDNVYLAHRSDIIWKTQLSASRETTVNQFDIQKSLGHLKLSPASDTWYDIEKREDKIIKGDTVTNTKPGLTYGDWDFNWSGVPSTDLGDYQVGDVVSQSSAVGETYSTSKVTGAYTATESTYQTRDTTTYAVTGVQTLKENLGTAVLSETTIQAQRAKFVSFKVTGLRPNTQHFVFFDGMNITDYVQSSAGTAAYQPMASLAADSPYLAAENRYKNELQFPDELGGPTDIITDADGSASGWILLPSNPQFTFSTGEHVISFNDVSVAEQDKGLSYAKTEYTSAGILRVVQDSILTTRVVEVSGFLEPGKPEVVSTELLDFSNEAPPPVINNNTYVTNEITEVTEVNNITNVTEVTEVIEKTVIEEKSYEPIIDNTEEDNDVVITTNEGGILEDLLDAVQNYEPKGVTPVVYSDPTGLGRPVTSVSTVNGRTSVTFGAGRGGDTFTYGTGTSTFEPTCFMPWTMITMEDGSKKPISEIKVGDKVLSDNCECCGKQKVNTVIAVEMPKLGTRKVYGINGRKPFVSEEHPVMTTEGWACVNKDTLMHFEFPTFEQVVREELKDVIELKVGQTLITKDGEEKITTLVPSEFDHDQLLYNLMLDGNNRYYAEDILVHNKCGGGMDACGNCGNG